MVAWPDVWRRLEAQVAGSTLVGDAAGLRSEAEATEADAVGVATESDAVGYEGKVPRGTFWGGLLAEEGMLAELERGSRGGPYREASASGPSGDLGYAC